MRFPLSQTEMGRVIVSVKGGKHLNPGMVRDLAGTVDAQRAQMGVLITMGTSTRGVREAGNRSGSYEHPLTGHQYPRVQVITVAELLEGKRPKMPTATLPYVKAKARNPQQPSFDL